jgi:hypothetical protein
LSGRDDARDAEITTDADMRRVAELVRPGFATTAPAAPDSGSRRPTVGYAPVYYPGTTQLADAQTITLGPGEERVGLDLQIQRLANSRVEGTVVGPTGQPAAGVRVWLTSAILGGSTRVSMYSSTTDAQGAFRIVGIPAGQYVAEVRPEIGPPGAAAVSGTWGRADVFLTAGSDASVSLRLQPGLRIQGRLVFETDGSDPPANVSTVRVFFTQEGGSGRSLGVVSADGRFEAGGLTPDRYRVSVTAPMSPGSRDPTWYLKSATLGGQDMADDAVDLQSIADLDSAVLVITNRVSEVSGVIQDAAGRPAPEYFIVVFPADRALWTWSSRRIQQTRPAHDGRYTIRNLPAGDYLIGAVTDVEQNEWFEPAFLEMLYAASLKFSLPDAGRVVQNLGIR